MIIRSILSNRLAPPARKPFFSITKSCINAGELKNDDAEYNVYKEKQQHGVYKRETRASNAFSLETRHAREQHSVNHVCKDGTRKQHRHLLGKGKTLEKKHVAFRRLGTLPEVYTLETPPLSGSPKNLIFTRGSLLGPLTIVDEIPGGAHISFTRRAIYNIS